MGNLKSPKCPLGRFAGFWLCTGGWELSEKLLETEGALALLCGFKQQRVTGRRILSKEQGLSLKIFSSFVVGEAGDLSWESLKGRGGFPAAFQNLGDQCLPSFQ